MDTFRQYVEREIIMRNSPDYKKLKTASCGLEPVVVLEDKPLHYYMLEYERMYSNDKFEFFYEFKDAMGMNNTRFTIPEKYIRRSFCYIDSPYGRAFVTMSSADVSMYIRYVLAKIKGNPEIINWKPPVQED